MTTAVVIGGGVAGLATAALLGRAGLEVTLIEKNDLLGGRVGMHDQDGFHFDTGPSWYLMPDAFDRFFAQLGTSTEEHLDLVPLSPAYRVFSEGFAPVDVESGIENVEKLFAQLEPGSAATTRKYLASAQHTYDIALRRFLYTTFRTPAPFINREVLPQFGPLISLLARSLQSWVERDFSDRRIRQILQYPAVFLSSTPRRTPAMYHLLSATDLVDQVRYPRGGFRKLVDALTQLAVEQGVHIRTNTPALGISTQPGPKGRTQVTGVRTPDGHIPADIVVSGADLHHTERDLLPKQLWSVRSWRRKDPGISCIVACLGVQGELPELVHHQLILSADWERDFAAIAPTASGTAHDFSRSVYVCKNSATDPSVAPEGCSNIFILIPVQADEHFGSGGSPQVETIVDAVISLIEERTGAALADNIMVRHTLGPTDFHREYHAWRGNAIGLAHTLWQSAFLRGRNASKKVDGLYFAGATTVPGVGLPMCLISAENVVTRLKEEGKLRRD
ncbi:phytoene desaturase family protein [Corynebacterium epidermidicanis]|uniref:Phytoene desaturase n=1 Tax=Corynebacterium epidermidicanis TaxID=1050174 RepID=A0A0G3GRB7_9CORY|nr:phytoene desaturase family protein [Corynebacterium epidermidicanis]AKK03649.1 phytoene desaturase [Corynebacterium epidermidicanis]